MKETFLLIVVEADKVVYIKERKAKRMMPFGNWAGAIVTYKGKNLRVMLDSNYETGDKRKDFVILQYDQSYENNHSYRSMPLYAAMDYPEIAEAIR